MTVTETPGRAHRGVAPAGPRGQRRDHAVRRPHRRRRRRPDRPRGRDRRPHRPQRRRQDDLLQLPHRHVHPDRGPGHAQRRRPCRPKPLAVVRAGMARTFQNIRLFANMTALENVMVGRYCRTSSMALTSILRGPKLQARGGRDPRAGPGAARLRRAAARPTELLARNMPYGDQRRLEIARALATDPQLLLLDEPTAGMNPQETEATMNLIFKIRDSGLAVVVIEHDMRFIFNLCDRVLCLVRGETARRGHARRGAVRPPGHRGLPRQRRRGRRRARDRHARGQGPRGLLRQDRGRQGHHASPSTRARSSPSSAPTAPARRPPCAPSPGCSGPAAGAIIFQGKDLTTASPPTTSSQLGLAHSPEGRRIFPRLTVEENLLPRRVRPQGQGASTPTSTRRSTCSRSSGSAAPSRPAPSPAASSRCWPWAGR